MKYKIVPSKNTKSLLLTLYEGYSTYTIVVPMPYAIRFFAEGLQSSLETLQQNEDSQTKLNEAGGEKAEIQERLRKSIALFEEYLKTSGRWNFWMNQVVYSKLDCLEGIIGQQH